MTEIVNLPGTKNGFAVGLSWRHEDAAPKPKQMRALSMSNGRWGLVRTTTTGAIQAGFCEPVEGIKSPTKLRALAAVVADHRPQPWMGLYRLAEDRFWYIAVRDGQAVIPGGDVIGTLEEVMRVRDTHLGHGDWTEIEGTVEDLAEMARMTPRPLTLRDLQASPWKAAIISGSALAAVGVVGLGVWAWQHHEDVLEQQARAIQQSKLIAARDALRNSQSKILPWTHEPMPSIALDACSRAWSTQDLALNGWTLATWGCRIERASIAIDTTWDRNGGVAANAPGTLSLDGEHSSLTEQQPSSFPESTSHAESETAARRSLWTVAQTQGLALLLANSASAPVPLPGAPTNIANENPWSPLPASMKQLAPPWYALSAPFDGVPGLRIRDVNWSAANAEWTTNATMYTMRPMPHSDTKPQALTQANQQGAKS